MRTKVTPPQGVLRKTVFHEQSRGIGRIPPVVAAPPVVDHAELQRQQRQREEAVRQAEQMKLLEARAEEGRLAGFERGMQEGFAQGVKLAQEKAQQQLDERLGHLDALFGMLDSARLAMAESVEDDLVELAYTTVCRLLAREAFSRETVRAQIASAIGRYATETIVCIRVAPADLEWIQSDEAVACIVERHSSRNPLRWMADSSVDAGGCVVECAAGAIDARLDTQLQRVKDELLRVRAARAAETA